MVSKTAELVASSPITRTPIVGAKNSVGTRERVSNHINSSIFIDLATIWVILLHPPPNFALKSANVARKRVALDVCPTWET
jgi:hypothetical protein